MAETKTKSRSKPKAKARSARKPKSSKSQSSKSRSSKSNARSRSGNNASTPADKAKAVGQTIESGAKEAGNTVGRAVSKAKVPLLAGGAALAGVAGGAAIGAHQARRHRGVAGVKSEDLGKAARKMGDFGAQMGEVALELRRSRRAASNGKEHRSPIEVVLEGLTSRR